MLHQLLVVVGYTLERERVEEDRERTSTPKPLLEPRVILNQSTSRKFWLTALGKTESTVALGMVTVGCPYNKSVCGLLVSGRVL